MARRLSDFRRLEVLTEEGKSLGRMLDLRCHGAPTSGRAAEAARVDTLVYGPSGILERLGLREATECVVPWSDIVKIEAHRIIVRAVASRGRHARRNWR